MGTWITLHYGGNVHTVGLSESLCGMKLGEPGTWASTRQAGTYRPYELLETAPDNCRPCPVCREALDFYRKKTLAAERVEHRDTIRRARRKIPDLMESGKWKRIAELATAAHRAKEALKP